MAHKLTCKKCSTVLTADISSLTLLRIHGLHYHVSLGSYSTWKTDLKDVPVTVVPKPGVVNPKPHESIAHLHCTNCNAQVGGVMSPDGEPLLLLKAKSCLLDGNDVEFAPMWVRADLPLRRHEITRKRLPLQNPLQEPSRQDPPAPETLAAHDIHPSTNVSLSAGINPSSGLSPTPGSHSSPGVTPPRDQNVARAESCQGNGKVHCVLKSLRMPYGLHARRARTADFIHDNYAL
eukprot:jgi/Mesvir1/17951/Mv12997-RA.1